MSSFEEKYSKWKKSLVRLSQKNLYLMNRNPLLFILVKVVIVKLPRSGALPAARQIAASCPGPPPLLCSPQSV
jgi:hypothetical protein